MFCISLVYTIIPEFIHGTPVTVSGCFKAWKIQLCWESLVWTGLTGSCVKALCLFKRHSVRSLLLGNWKPVQLPKKLNCISWRLISQQWGGPVRWSLIPSQKCLSVVTCFLTHPSPFIKSVVVFWWFQKQLSRPVDQYFSLSPQHRRFLEEINFPLNTELF